MIMEKREDRRKAKLEALQLAQIAVDNLREGECCDSIILDEELKKIVYSLCMRKRNLEIKWNY